MPAFLNPTVNGRIPQSEFLSKARQNFDYSYPEGLDLHPQSETHEKLRRAILTRALESQRIMQSRYDEWRRLDETLKAYVPVEPHALDNKKTKEDEDPLERVVMPVSFATLETLLTYFSAAFLQDPIFTYEGRGPEDVYGAFLLTQHIAHQADNARLGLALHTQWRDAFVYGFGAVHTHWYRKFGKRVRKKESGFRFSDLFFVTGGRREVEDAVLWEGNKLSNIDPYRYFPDPSVAVQDVQDGEYVGWLDEDNYMALRGREKDPDDFLFNVQYLRDISGLSQFSTLYNTARDDLFFTRHVTHSNQPIDVLYMYVNLIPAEWELGKSTYPEKWLFMLAADQVIIAAQPLGLYHDMFPVAVCAPDTDGYTATPAGRLSITLDLQTIIDFLYSSHIANVRKAINDMIVVDPSLVNIYDLNSPKPGKLIRMRRGAWGRGGIDAGIKQLAVTDITANHVNDASFLINFMREVQGTTDNLQGAFAKRSERISATEARDARVSGLARLERLAKLVSMQSMQPIAYMLAYHTQQFAQEERYVKVLGEWPERLQKQFGVPVDDNRTLVDPLDMAIDFDVKLIDGTIPGSESAETWIQVFQIAAQNPILMQQLDIQKIFSHIARHLGARNIEDFLIRAPQAAPQVLPDEEVEQQVQAGNLAPLGGDGAPPPNFGF